MLELKISTRVEIACVTVRVSFRRKRNDSNNVR